MIESRQQLADAFARTSKAFLDNPNPVTGIDLDDAAVALKRYALTEMHDQELASILGRFAKCIRALDVDTLDGLIRDVVSRLS